MRAIAAAIAVLLSAATARAQDAPPFQLVRPDEDYGYLRDPARRTGWADPIKYVPLNAAGTTYLSLGGEVRVRLDVLDAARFGVGAEADSYALTRVLLHADLHLSDQVRVYGELGYHDAPGKHAPFSPSDRDHLDVQNLFIDLKPDEDGPLRLRLGRQELNFNTTQRFVSVREGPNLRQSFDGLRVTWSSPAVKIEGFAVRPLIDKLGALDDRADPAQAFYGVYASAPFKAAGGDFAAAAYAFELDRRAAVYGQVSGQERRHSFGLRLAGTRGRLDLDWEAMAQGGRFAGRDIQAWGFGADSGYTFVGAWSPRLGLRFDGGSGDRDPQDGKLQTFNPLFPKGAYFDETALNSYANRLSTRVSLGVRPSRTVSIEVSATSRWRQTVGDAIYLQPAIALANTAHLSGRPVSEALALDATWKATRSVTLSGELVHAAVGSAIQRAGGHDTDFAMLIAQFRF